MKNVFIAGASGGIGSVAAKIFAENGYLVAAGRNKSPRGSDDYLWLGADAADEDEVNAAVDAAEHEFGRLDALVYAAGIAEQKLFTDISTFEWRKMLAVHLDGAFNFCKAVLPGMIRRKQGSIVIVSSVWGLSGAACEVHYSAAKAGQIGLAKALAKEVAPSGIRVNCVAPGVIKTDMLADFSEPELEELRERTPLGRLGTPEDVARAIYFLSDTADFITGQVLTVDGGFIL